MTLTAPDHETRQRTRPHVTVLIDRCAGCQECVVRCPTGALTMDTLHWVAQAEQTLCVGCRQCTRTCPFSAITVEGPLLVADRVDPPHGQSVVERGDTAELRHGYEAWDEALAETARCLQCPDPTCVRGCPAHNDIPAFIAAIRDRNLGKAHEVLRRTSVLPDVCSRVCNQNAQCEGACTWSLAGGKPVAIGRLERFVTDQSPVPPPMVHADGGAGRGMSVAVVGAGPAGIGAAWELIEAGAAVTVYDKESTPGGLLGWGIPRFTLPEAVANRAWGQLIAAGVELRSGVAVRPDALDDLLHDHDAVVLAHGATLPMRLNVPGAELDGVTDATTFLHRGKAALEYGEDPADFRSSFGIDAAEDRPGRAPNVLVLGAGNTAMDVARTARRLGMMAVCVDWLDERFALARPDELDEARSEGVDVRFSRTLVRLEGAGRVERALLAHTRQRKRGRLPKVLQRKIETVEVALVVMAMGYRVDPAFAAALPGTPVRRVDARLADRRWQASGILTGRASSYADHQPVGQLAVGREVGLWASARPLGDRLWAAGDALVGPSTVVEAMAQGKRSAKALLAESARLPDGRRRLQGESAL